MPACQHPMRLADTSDNDNRTSEMQFALTDEQQMIGDTTRAFVEKELYPHEAEVERTGHLEMDVVEDLG